jgi:hypothetical protein
VKVLERFGLAPLIDFHQDMYNERFLCPVARPTS